MTSFNLITGFLGSGKTTLISNLIQELSVSKRIAVIQNEFAPTGIDGKELKMINEDFTLIEINNGSVFCVCQLGSFVKSMQSLIENYAPEIIYLEASGLADPLSIVELLQMNELNHLVSLDKSICMVDAPNFFRGLSTLTRFKHQLMVADHIIINKTDLFTGNIDKIKTSIRDLNPFAEIILTSYANIKWQQLTEDSNIKDKAAQRFKGAEPAGRPEELRACVLRTHDKISEGNLKTFLLELQKTCPRTKGHFNLADGRIVSVNHIYDFLELKELKNYTGPTEFVAFGANLDISYLRNTFKRFL
jgi:G3E family GTPase